MKRRFMSLMLAVLMLAMVALPVSAAASSFNTEVRNSIAPIAYYQEIGNEEVLIGNGTCFFIGKTPNNPEYVVTNHHVVESFLAEGAGESTTNLYAGEDGFYIYQLKGIMRVHFDENHSVEAYLEAYDEQADLAILRLEKPTDLRTALKLKEPTEDMVGSSVYVVGYPGISDSTITDPVSHWGPEDASVTTGSISRLVTTSGTGVKRVQIDAAIRMGNSGGPLVDADGNVLGINARYITGSNEQVYESVNVSELKALCDANSIPYMEAGSDSNMIWIAAAIAVVAVIVIVLVLRKKKAAPASAPVSVAAPAPAPVIPAAPVSGNELRFQCTAGAFAGKRFSIDGTVRIGRDPAKNDLVYPGNTQGISGVHCILIMKDGTLYLQDLGSTYGTFINGGQRLAANQPVALKIGDRFTLGSDRESFVITPRGGL